MTRPRLEENGGGIEMFTWNPKLYIFRSISKVNRTTKKMLVTSILGEMSRQQNKLFYQGHTNKTANKLALC